MSKATEDLIERRRALNLDLTALHLERLLTNASCRIALQEEKYRQSKLLEAVQGRRNPKYRRVSLDYRVADNITKRRFSHLPGKRWNRLRRDCTPVSSLINTRVNRCYFHGEIPSHLQILAAIQTMKEATASKLENNDGLLRAGGLANTRLPKVLAAHLTLTFKR
ncbi:unnamed protein product [Strongylus vulgaris]|uniref:Uncharacterized protein n=1 Tax=Strongylus vulgaris TaxID=40348 RepID=A0A3P7J476_STRVU|nr:unnamed protein product [Strongylus vulgaris]